ncbi:YgiT-type zinc finger protein [Oribacterium sp. NK2B42]|uniref:YgiT-type zinc finger protein n=1 Tax=Oribacterium sp. NK2B42 TaxID=689781 RepID=UPI000492B6C7|nr:YgiT-type zinc finger protein [Oribacterium sp. NK2B42]
MCNACFGDNKTKTTTTFTVEYKGCIIVIRNVPCLECQKCGEITFTDEVAEQLEKIVAAAKTVLQDVSVIDYSKVA